MNKSTTTLCALHLAGDALILWLGYTWLGMGESDTGRLALSAMILVLFACSGCLARHGTAFVHFDGAAGSSLRRAAASRSAICRRSCCLR